MRYLVRLDNNQAYAPKDVRLLEAKIRELLGSTDKIGNLRVSTTAIELDLFAAPSDLGRTKSLLEDEKSVCVSVLGRAKEKLGTLDQFKGLDIRSLRVSIEQILKDNMPMLLRIQWVKTKTHAPPS